MRRAEGRAPGPPPSTNPISGAEPMGLTFFLQNVVNALQWGSFYGLIALGYSMVYSILMLFNFAHGDIFMTGSYIGVGAATGLVALAEYGAFTLPNWRILVLTILI